MNSVHLRHNRENFLSRKKHFIFAFHDTTFECIAESFTVSLHHGSLKSSIDQVLQFFNARPV